MKRFTQFHLLTAYPPANLNRDDAGRPKTAVMGGVERLRVSSQALKRAWRTSDKFKETLDGCLGSRTQRLGEEIEGYLTKKGMNEKDARENARKIAVVFGKLKAQKSTKDNEEKGGKKGKVKGDTPTRIEQLAFIGPAERKAAYEYADKALKGKIKEISPDEILLRVDKVADIAMFGRMFADSPKHNREAAVQVSHAVTTHRVTVEDDYYTAIDDLKNPGEDAGAGFIGVQEFASGVFYIYVCVDINLLLKNLGESREIAGKALAALLEAAATVAPKGKQASFASRTRASYILVEKGSQQPRSLAAAFFKPIGGRGMGKDPDYIISSIKALEEFKNNLNKAYGPCAEEEHVMDITKKDSGKMANLIKFISDL